MCICEKCHQEIDSKKDLVVTSPFPSLKLHCYHLDCYHLDCYNADLKMSIPVPRVNSVLGTVKAILALLLLLCLWSYNDNVSVSIIAPTYFFALPTINRIYSFVKYERKLK